MRKLLKKLEIKKKEYSILAISILVFCLPIYIFGAKDVETYYWGFFSNQVLNEYIFNPFKDFIGYYGPGIQMPIGFFPYFHPLSIIFANDLKLFTFFSIILNILIQYNYLKKIFRQFNLKKTYSILPLLVIFSISNYNYVWSSDWIQVFYTYTFFFPCLYYFIKLNKKNDLNSYLKLSFIIGFSLLNSHPGNFINFFIFLFFLSIFNRYFFHFKNKYFYIFLFFLILIYIEPLYFQITEYSKYIYYEPNLIKIVQGEFLWKHYIAAIALPMNFSEWTGINRYPFYGFIFYLSFYQAIKMILNNQSKKNLYINYIFFVLIIFSLSGFIKKFTFISTVWQFRDIINIISLILFFIFLESLKETKTKKIILSLCFFYIILFYIGNFYKYIPYNKQNNIIKNNEISLEFKNLFNNLEKDKLKNRVYFSPKFYNDLNSYKLNSYGLFANTDLIKLNLSPFNGSFKSIYVGKFNKQFTRTRSYIKPSFKYINSEFFLNIFDIRFLLIYENELNEIDDLSNFKIKNFINLDKSKNSSNKKLFLLERVNYLNKITINNDLTKNFDCNNIFVIDCIYKIQNDLQINKSIKINYNKEKSVYEFLNNSDDDVTLVAPFLYDKNWNSDSLNSINHINEIFMLLTIKKNDKLTLLYKNKTRFFLKVISLLSLSFLIIFLIISKNKLFRKNVF